MKKNEIIPYNPKLKIPARELRNNSTKSEIIFWNKTKMETGKLIKELRIKKGMTQEEKVKSPNKLV